MNLSPDLDHDPAEIEPPVVQSRLQRWGLRSWHLWLGIGFSLAFLWLALRGVDLTETADALRRVNLIFLGLAVVSYTLTTVAKAGRWRLLLAARKAPSFARAFSVLSIGLMANTFLPARLGEVARAYLMGEAEADSKVYVLGSVALEKVADLLFMLFSLVVLLTQMALPEWLIGPARGTAVLISILLPCFLLLAWKSDLFLRLVGWSVRFIPLAWRAGLLRQTGHGLASLEVVRRPRLLFGLFGWSMLIWILSMLTNFLVFIALDLSLPIWAALLLLVALQVGAAVPSSPGRIGVFQYLAILTLSIFAVDKNVALGYSIVLYLVIYVPMILIGVYCLWREKITWQKLERALTMLNRVRRKAK